MEEKILEHLVGPPEMLVSFLRSRQHSGSAPCVARDWLWFGNQCQSTPPFCTRCLEGNLMVAEN